jgi:hypothetical protein
VSDVSDRSDVSDKSGCCKSVTDAFASSLYYYLVSFAHFAQEIFVRPCRGGLPAEGESAERHVGIARPCCKKEKPDRASNAYGAYAPTPSAGGLPLHDSHLFWLRLCRVMFSVSLR